MSKQRPNILWISFEDTNPVYGCYGDPVACTPNLDRLAAEGCRWTQAFSTAGVCAPARSAVITGMYPTAIGTHHMRTTHTQRATPELPTPYSACPPPDVHCFTEYFRAAGYYCTNNSKTDYQFEPPFTAWDECSATAHWRNRRDPKQPFFAVFNPTLTHESGMWDDKNPPLRLDPNAIPLPPYFPDTPKVRASMARMYAHIEQSDVFLGRLLEELAADGLAENTLVVHWSDHGPLPRGKRWPYDSGIHVPLIVRWPGMLKPGSVNDQLVSTIDLGPAMLAAAGLALPRHLQGRPFLGPLAEPPRRYVYASRDRHDLHYDHVRAVRDTRFKYIRHWRPDQPYLGWIPYRNRHPIIQELWRGYAADTLTGAQKLLFEPRPPEELYDTKTDPHEINNLANEPKYRLELDRLRQALDDWMNDIGDMGDIPESEMVERWYPNGQRPTTAAPLLIGIDANNPGLEPATDGGRYRAPALLQMHCATQGASIGYRFADDPAGQWRLYHAPLRLATAGEIRIQAKAIRIGYHESPEVSVGLHVSGSQGESGGTHNKLY